jgi:serine/threonine protein phosphatase PrpC
LPPYARLLLCSDGLWNMVPEDRLQEIVSHHKDPQETCNQLIKLANERGGLDNISVVVVQMPG